MTERDVVKAQLTASLVTSQRAFLAGVSVEDVRTAALLAEIVLQEIETGPRNPEGSGVTFTRDHAVPKF